VEAAKRMEQELPNTRWAICWKRSLWWRIWCTSADFKYGMSAARRRPSSKRTGAILSWLQGSKLAESQIKQSESAEMQFMLAWQKRPHWLYGLRGENRNAARSGVRGREHFQRAKALTLISLTPTWAGSLQLLRGHAQRHCQDAFSMEIMARSSARRSAPARSRRTPSHHTTLYLALKSARSWHGAERVHVIVVKTQAQSAQRDQGPEPWPLEMFAARTPRGRVAILTRSP